MDENMDLKFRISAENRAKKATDEVNKDLSSMEAKTKSLVAGFGRMTTALAGIGVSFAAIGAGIKEALDVSGEYETRMLTLQGTLQATGYAAGLTAEEIRAMAQEIALGTLESTEGVERAAAKLLTFKSVGADSFRTVLELGTDLSALGFGSLESNVVNLAKALEDPVRGITALRRAGVSFTADQQDMIKAMVNSGRAAEAQGLILQAVAGQVERAGKAAAQGLQGAWDTFGQEVEELNVAIGDAFAGMSIAVAGAGATLAQWLEDQVHGATATARAYRDLGEALLEWSIRTRDQIRSMLGLSDQMTALERTASEAFGAITTAAKRVGIDGLVPINSAVKAVNGVVAVLADTFQSSASRQREAVRLVTVALEQQRAALGGVQSQIGKVTASLKGQFEGLQGAIAGNAKTIDSLDARIFALTSSTRDFTAELRGVSDGERALAGVNAAMRETQSLQEQLNRARADGDTEREVQLLERIVELNKEAARTALSAGEQSAAENANRRSVQAAADLVRILKEQRDEVKAQDDAQRELLQTMRELVQEAGDAAAELVGLREGGDIQLDIDLTNFKSQLGELTGLIEQRRELEIGLDSLLDAKQQLEALGGITTKSLHQVRADTAAAERAIRELKRDTRSTHTVYVREVRQHAQGGYIQPARLAAGGFPRRQGRISGPGTSTSDSIPSMLSAGEFVMPAKSVAKYGVAFMEALRRGLVPEVPRFSAGGLAGGIANAGQSMANLPEMAVNLSVQGGQPMRLTTSRDTARNLANALRDLERGR